jgi:hypothetical protein
LETQLKNVPKRSKSPPHQGKFMDSENVGAQITLDISKIQKVVGRA